MYDVMKLRNATLHDIALEKGKLKVVQRLKAEEERILDDARRRFNEAERLNFVKPERIRRRKAIRRSARKSAGVDVEQAESY